MYITHIALAVECLRDIRTDISAYISLTLGLMRYTHCYQCVYLVKRFHKTSQYFDAESETSAAYIEALRQYRLWDLV